MNRQDIINTVSREFTLTKAETGRIIDYVAQMAAESLRSGDRVYIRGFGSLARVTRKKKRTRSIDSGKMITIPQRETVEFRPAAALEEKIRK